MEEGRGGGEEGRRARDTQVGDHVVRRHRVKQRCKREALFCGMHNDHRRRSRGGASVPPPPPHIASQLFGSLTVKICNEQKELINQRCRNHYFKKNDPVRLFNMVTAAPLPGGC